MASSSSREAAADSAAAATATVGCVCGRVLIEFADSTVLRRLECACRDCLQALRWAAYQGGPPAPEPSRCRIPDLIYLRNDLRVVRGAQHLRWYTLRSDAKSTRCVSACCNSTLLVDHPAYAQHVVMIFLDSCIVHAGGVAESACDGDCGGSCGCSSTSILRYIAQTGGGGRGGGGGGEGGAGAGAGAGAGEGEGEGGASNMRPPDARIYTCDLDDLAPGEREDLPAPADGVPVAFNHGAEYDVVWGAINALVAPPPKSKSPQLPEAAAIAAGEATTTAPGTLPPSNRQASLASPLCYGTVQDLMAQARLPIECLALIEGAVVGEVTVSSQPFGTTCSGMDVVQEYVLCNGRITAGILTYGAILRRLLVPGREGVVADVVLGCDSVSDYESHSPFFGATVGRFAGRIRQAVCDPDSGRSRGRGEGGGGCEGVRGEGGEGGRVKLAACDGADIGPNCLHGGPVGFDKRVWGAEAVTPSTHPDIFPIASSSSSSTSKRDGKNDGTAAEADTVASWAGVRLTLVSPDKDQGFPGRVEVVLTVILTHDDQLIFDYTAHVTGATTPLSLTNHSYFNLAGHDAGPDAARAQRLQIAASSWLPTGPDGIPTGEERDVTGTPWDLRMPTEMGVAADSVAARAPLWPHGDAYVLRPEPTKNNEPPMYAADLEDPASGRAMVVYTTEPVCQLYYSTLLSAPGKNAAKHGPMEAVCLEMQRFADAVNGPHADLPFKRTPEQIAYCARHYACTVLHPAGVGRQYADDRPHEYRQTTRYVFEQRRARPSYQMLTCCCEKIK